MSPRKKKELDETAEEVITQDEAETPDSDGSAEAEAAAVAHAVAAVESTPEPDPIVTKMAPTATAPDVPPCALESAVIGAKCVVSRTDEGKAVRLLDPSGSVTLDPSDLFYTLPAGAKVRKVSETEYAAFKLGQSDAALFTCGSAREAVTRYLALT